MRDSVPLLSKYILNLTADLQPPAPSGIPSSVSAYPYHLCPAALGHTEASVYSKLTAVSPLFRTLSGSQDTRVTARVFSVTFTTCPSPHFSDLSPSASQHRFCSRHQTPRGFPHRSHVSLKSVWLFPLPRRLLSHQATPSLVLPPPA